MRVRGGHSDPLRPYLGLDAPSRPGARVPPRAESPPSRACVVDGDPVQGDLSVLTDEELDALVTLLRVLEHRTGLATAFAGEYEWTRSAPLAPSR